MDFHQTWCVHWYSGDLVEDYCWENFVNVWQSSAHDTSVFSFLDDNVSKCQWIFTILGICIDIVEICFGIDNGQISSIFDSCLPAIHPYFTFGTITSKFTKFQWIFTKFDMCIYIVEICFGIALWQFRQFLTELSAGNMIIAGVHRFTFYQLE